MKINAYPRLGRLFKLRTILLVVMLSVLFFPLVSVYYLRFYESELVRKTELQLISQASALSAAYRELLNLRDNSALPMSLVSPRLDLSIDPVHLPRPAAQVTFFQADPKYLVASERMQVIFSNTQHFTLTGMRLLDNQGVVIAGADEVGLSLAHVLEVKQALQGEVSTLIRMRISNEPPPPIASISRGTSIRIFCAFPVIHQKEVIGIVYLSRTPQNILKHLYANRKNLLIISVMIVGLTGLLASFISSRLSRPIRELIDQTERVTRGEVQTVELLHEPGTYELSKLSGSFSTMSKALYERSQYINEFASHVSHEFKTPLTSMQGSLELLADHIEAMTLEEQQRFISNLQKDTERLKSLVNRLLEQARADSSKRSTETSRLLNILAEKKAYYAERHLILNFEPNDVDKILSIAQIPLDIIFKNLLDNSVFHQADCVDIKMINQGEYLVLSLCDNGTGISKANRKRIFTPFFTTRRESGGTGLGLGIIEALLKTWGGKISLDAQRKTDHKGACFVLELPIYRAN
ncbi:MAG: HAMP domain-containing histidine kinase [Thiotrichaceae bacterium]|nr:HAMP domain-containing histidine kinase [Thiotrichaceae bacterium]